MQFECCHFLTKHLLIGQCLPVVKRIVLKIYDELHKIY